METDRVQEKLAKHAGLIGIRSQENKTEILETVTMMNEEKTAVL